MPNEGPLALGDDSPFDLPGQGEAAALCLHGLTSSPYEVRPLGEALASRGIRAVGPVLPGHNETPEALAATPYRAWLEAAYEHFRRLAEQHQHVFVVGVSMGGLLTLHLAANESLPGAVVIGVPLRLRHRFIAMTPWLKFVKQHLPKNGVDIRDPAAQARQPGYRVMPVAAIHELMRLQKRVRGLLSRVRAPLFVAHGLHDRTADPRDARAIVARVASTEIRLSLLENSGHVVPVDFDGPQLCRSAADFLAERS